MKSKTFRKHSGALLATAHRRDTTHASAHRRGTLSAKGVDAAVLRALLYSAWVVGHDCLLLCFKCLHRWRWRLLGLPLVVVVVNGCLVGGRKTGKRLCVCANACSSHDTEAHGITYKQRLMSIDCVRVCVCVRTQSVVVI